MPEGTHFETALRSELRKIYWKTIGVRFASGIVSFVTASAWLFLGVVLWAAAVREPELWQTLIVSQGALFIAIFLFAALVVHPLARMPRFSQFALEVEGQKDFHHIVAAGFEFSEHPETADRYAPELIREVVSQAAKSIAGLQVRFLFLRPRQLLAAPIAYLALVILVVVAFVAPTRLFDAGRWLTSPERVAAVKHKANLYGSPGDVTVLAGSDVIVNAFDFGQADEPVTISYNLSGDFWKTEPTSRVETVESESQPRQHRFTFHDVRNSLVYAFDSGGIRSPEYHIHVVNKPIVTALSVILTPPAYTGESADTLVDSGGNVQALEGTAVTISARANNTLAAAWVQFGKGDIRPVQFEGHDFGFEFTALQDGSYSILLEDAAGHRTDEPLAYSIEVYKDNPPVLDVLKPGVDATLPRNLVVDLGFIASDDFGMAKAGVYYRKNGEDTFRGRAISLGNDAGKREIAKSYSWDVSDVPLFPGNYIEYFVQVEDNNIVTGPGVTKSRIFHIAVPTMAELFEDAEEESAKRTDLLEQTMNESQELKDRLEKISREFKKNENLDWTQKKELDKAMASQENIQEKLSEIQQSLEETLQSLSDNQMTSQEIGEKLEQIQRLIDDINDEALDKYVEELREAMEKLNPDEIERALENLNVSAEDLLESLERTESLLREIQEEQEMEELVRSAKDLMESQEEVSGETQDTDAGDTKKMEELAKDQSDVSEKAQEMAEKMQQMAENTQNQEVAEQMKRASEEFSDGQTQQSMKEAVEQLQQGDKQEAMENQQQAMDDLVALFTRVANMQMQAQMQSQRRASENLQRLANSTLALSFKQEVLTNRLRDQVSTDEGTDVRTLAKDQQTYTRAVEQVANELREISKRSLAVSENLLELLGQTLDSMRSTTLFLEQNKAFMSAASASQAITSLNEATIELLTAAQNNMQGGGGSGQQSSQMSALQQMLQQQQQLTRESQALLQMRAAQEKLMQERQAAVRRLAGQQRSLQETAEEIAKNADGDRILGRMDKIIEEMEEVIRDLDSGVLDEQTVRNEDRILSRLLDASRSVHSRDYEKKRTSETAPPDIFSKTLGGDSSRPNSQLLREEIRRAMTLKAPGEFEDLIKLYFRALAEETPPTSPNR